MKYSELVEVYEELSKTSKRLEKVEILSKFLVKLRKEGKKEWVYLLNGRVVPDYDNSEFGISRQLAIKAIASTYGVSEENIVEQFRKIGDLGEIAENVSEKRKQSALFSKILTIDKVFENLKKISAISGKGAVEKKIGIVSEILNSALPLEAKYIIRIILSDLRIGVASGVLRDAITKAFFSDDVDIGNVVEEAYDLVNDWSVVFDAASKGKEELKKITVSPGRPLNVMLSVKVDTIEEAFEVCGRPAALEYKYDGFRVLITKEKDKIELYTRKLEKVTLQFPDVVEVVRKNIKGESYILDSEVVGYDPKTKIYRPFEAISQRIKRKYDIDKLTKDLPVEVNVFDILYLNGKSTMHEIFSERRKIVEKIIKIEEFRIRPSQLLITGDTAEAENFYEEALEIGEEGIMIKRLDAPYRQGRRVGFMAKLKPVVNDLDLVIVKAEYGSGKRGGWLTSYTVACKTDGKYVEVGKVSSGLKEKGEEGMSYDEMTNLLRPLIIEEDGNEVIVSPKVIVAVTYQNIQPSSSYSSGYALRFPRIARYRPDKSVSDIATLADIEKEVKKGERK